MQLFAGSISSSGPVHSQVRFPEYFNVVTKSLKYFRGQPCIDALEVGYKKVRACNSEDAQALSMEPFLAGKLKMMCSKGHSVFVYMQCGYARAVCILRRVLMVFV